MTTEPVFEFDVRVHKWAGTEPIAAPPKSVGGGLVRVNPGQMLRVGRALVEADREGTRSIAVGETELGEFPNNSIPKVLFSAIPVLLGESWSVLVGMSTSRPAYWKINHNDSFRKANIWVPVVPDDVVRIYHRRQPRTWKPVLTVAVRGLAWAPPVFNAPDTVLQPQDNALNSIAERMHDYWFGSEPTAWPKNAYKIAFLCWWARQQDRAGIRGKIEQLMNAAGQPFTDSSSLVRATAIWSSIEVGFREVLTQDEANSMKLEQLLGPKAVRDADRVRLAEALLEHRIVRRADLDKIDILTERVS